MFSETLARSLGLTDTIPAENMCTIFAKYVTPNLRRPRPLVIRAWLWLAAEADRLTEKRLCLETILRLHPENEAATLALLLLDQRRPTS